MLPDEAQSFPPPHTGDWTCYHNTTAGDLVNTDTTDNVCYHRHQSQHQCHQCGSRVCFNKTILSLHNWASSNFWMIVQGPEMNQTDIWHSNCFLCTLKTFLETKNKLVLMLIELYLLSSMTNNTVVEKVERNCCLLQIKLSSSKSSVYNCFQARYSLLVGMIVGTFKL